MTAAEVKAHRDRLGLTQAALGERLGKTPVTISNWERGAHKIDPRSAEALKRMKPDDHRTFTVVLPDYKRDTESPASSETFVIVPSSREQVAAIRTTLAAMGAKKVS